MTAPCGARFADCRCDAIKGHHDPHDPLGPRPVHCCGVPGCGAMWVGPDHVVRLPFHAALPRRFGRPVLRSVA